MRSPAAACKTYSLASAIFVIATAFLVLIGWIFFIPILRSTVPGAAPMKANQALALIFAGTALILLLPKPTPKRPTGKYRLGQALALAVGLIGALTLIEYAFSWNLGIDRLFVRAVPGDVWSIRAFRMSATSALTLVLIGLSLLLLDFKIRARDWAAQVPAIAVSLIGLMVFVDYVYRGMTSYSIGNPALATLNSAIVFVLFGIGIVFARPDHGIMTVLAADSGAGGIARRLLVSMIVISFVIGPLTAAGQNRGYYDHAFGESLFTVFSVALISFVTLLTAIRLQRAEISQKEANKELQSEITERKAAEETIRLLSTPVLRLCEQLLILPIIGVIDAPRARQLTDQLLAAIRVNRAKVVVVDITGTASIDSTIAFHFLQTAEAAGLLGAKVILTGISKENAQTLVKIGVNMGNITIRGDLQSGIEEGERLLGFDLVKTKKRAV